MPDARVRLSHARPGGRGWRLTILRTKTVQTSPASELASGRFPGTAPARSSRSSGAFPWFVRAPARAWQRPCRLRTTPDPTTTSENGGHLNLFDDPYISDRGRASTVARHNLLWYTLSNIFVDFFVRDRIVCERSVRSAPCENPPKPTGSVPQSPAPAGFGAERSAVWRTNTPGSGCDRNSPVTRTNAHRARIRMGYGTRSYPHSAFGAELGGAAGAYLHRIGRRCGKAVTARVQSPQGALAGETRRDRRVQRQ